MLAGLTAGAAFLIRHPGLLLLPFGWLVIFSVKSLALSVNSSELPSESSKFKNHNSKLLLLFTLAFVLAILPQLYVNLRDTGSRESRRAPAGDYGARVRSAVERDRPEAGGAAQAIPAPGLS